MNIIDLSALVSVRNHIQVVINDKSASNRDDFNILNQKRIALDKKFVQEIKELDIEKLSFKEPEQLIADTGFVKFGVSEKEKPKKRGK